MAEKISRVAVVGAGTMGVQIAAHAACFGCDVSIFDLDPKALERSRSTLSQLTGGKGREPVVPFDEWLAAAGELETAADLAQALDGAELVIECAPENLEIKKAVFAEIDALAPAGALLATNSSSLPVSQIEAAVKRPERCLNLHFYQPTVASHMVDVMGGTRTAPEALEAAEQWVRSIGCAPLRVNKELLGFCFNRVWRAVKRETLYMWAEGFVDFKDVDRGWMIFTNMRLGPFGLMDAVGLDVIHDIEMVYYRHSQDPRDHPPERLKAMVERGDLGVKSGRGFYDYPDPEFSRPDFLKG